MSSASVGPPRPMREVTARSGYCRLDGLDARRVDAEDAVEAGDLEDPDDVLVRADDVEVAVARPHALGAAHEHAEGGGIDERDLGKVDDDSARAALDAVHEDFFELRRG